MAATEGFGITDPQNPRRARLEVQLPGKAFGFLPLLDARQQLALHETAHAVTDQLVAGVEVFLIGRHRQAPREGGANLPSACLVIKQDERLVNTTKQMRERACSRRRCVSRQMSRLNQRIREQARSHILSCGVCYRAIGLRPANECAKVPPSTSSSSPPNGTPWAIREVIRPLLVSNCAM